MDFFELSAFLALARTLHFAKAAGQVNTSPSALSRIVARLEEEAGVPLFERDTRRVALTEEGRLFCDFAREVLRQKETLHETLASWKGRLRGALRVWASVTACYSILPPFAAQLRLSHPDLHLAIQTGDPAEAETALRNDEVDLALAALPEEGLSGLPSFSVKRSPLVFVMAKDAPLPAWEQASYILPSRGLARERFDRWARNQKLKPSVAAETAGNEAILALARLGLGLGLVPRIVLDNSPFADGLDILPTLPELGEYDIGFAFYNRSPRFSQAVAGVLEAAYPEGSWKATSHTLHFGHGSSYRSSDSPDSALSNPSA